MTKRELIKELAKCDLTKSDLKEIINNHFINNDVNIEDYEVDLSCIRVRRKR